MPRARSRARAPVGTASIPTLPRSPSRMIAPLPNCFSIWPSVMSSDLSRSTVDPPGMGDAGASGRGEVAVGTTLRRGWDINHMAEVPRVWCSLERTPVRRKDHRCRRAAGGAPSDRERRRSARLAAPCAPSGRFLLAAPRADRPCSPPAPAATDAGAAPGRPPPSSTTTATTTAPTDHRPRPPPPAPPLHRSPGREPGSPTATSSSGVSRPRTSRPTST